MDRDRVREPEPCSPPEPPKTQPGASPGPTRWGICSAGAISHDFVVALKTLPPSEHTVTPRDPLGREGTPPQIHGKPQNPWESQKNLDVPQKTWIRHLTQWPG